jgi:hypothetical protein
MFDRYPPKSVVVGVDGSQAAIRAARRYPDVPVQVVAVGVGMKSSENRSSAIELAIVGRADADQIAELATPQLPSDCGLTRRKRRDPSGPRRGRVEHVGGHAGRTPRDCQRATGS